jgi:ketosteroid isomerase-like protein
MRTTGGRNVQLHRAANEAFNTRDVEAYVARCDPEIELHSAVTVPGGGAYQGHAGVRQWFRDIADAFGPDIRVEPESYFDLGEHTVSFHKLQGRGQRSGAGVATPAAHVCRWRNGLIVYFKGYVRREDAFSDMGVSPDAVEPIAP